MPPEDVKKERRDSKHKGKRRKGGTVEELKGNDSGPKGRQNPLSIVHTSVDNTPLREVSERKGEEEERGGNEERMGEWRERRKWRERVGNGERERVGNGEEREKGRRRKGGRER